MQDRYAGDIGDFTKFGLLKAINDQGLSIGLNWYKTEPLASELNVDGSYKQSDGKHTHFSDEIRDCDPVLADKLSHIAALHEARSIIALEEACLLPNAAYYNEPISIKDRKQWHRDAQMYFKAHPVDLVCLDPDNGLRVDSVKPNTPRSVKYAFYEEVLDYIEQGSSVLVYNHRSRKPELEYFTDIETRLQSEIAKRKLSYQPEILEITFPRYSVRDYIAISACPKHVEKIRTAFDTMLASKWGKARLCQKPLTMDISYSEFRARFPEKSIKRFLKYYQALPEEVMHAMVDREHAGTAIKACMASKWYKR